MQATDTKTYQVDLTEAEMQTLVHAVTGFYRVTNRQGTKISVTQTAHLINAMNKFKAAIDPLRAQIILPDHLQGLTDGSLSTLSQPDPG